MYIGRFLVAGPDGGAYRVSSRSFPNRRITAADGALRVVPTAAADETDNPYVSYTCVRPGDGRVTFGNGSHVDPIADKLALGYPARDALAMGLLTLDFERDEYDTPRIAAVVGDVAYVGIVRRNALLVTEAPAPTLVATYKLDAPEPIDVTWETATEAARGAYDLDYEHPICAAGVDVSNTGAVETAIYNGGGPSA